MMKSFTKTFNIKPRPIENKLLIQWRSRTNIKSDINKSLKQYEKLLKKGKTAEAFGLLNSIYNDYIWYYGKVARYPKGCNEEKFRYYAYKWNEWAKSKLGIKKMPSAFDENYSKIENELKWLVIEKIAQGGSYVEVR